MWQQSDNQIVQNQLSKQDKKIANQEAKMESELTGDKAVDSVITTPQSQWSPYQIAVANLNPDLKSKNKRYQSALNAKSVLENERVNLWQAWELMMNAYRESIDNTENAAKWMMNANAINASLQAWAAIAWSAGLATNPAAAAQTRASILNQANAQNLQIRSNADQNIANAYSNMAQIPATLSNIASSNRQAEANAIQAEANANLANAQAAYYWRQWTWTTYSSWWTKQQPSSSDDTTEDNEIVARLKKAAEANWLEFDPEQWIKWWTFVQWWEWEWSMLNVWWKAYNDAELNAAYIDYANWISQQK